MIISVPLQVIGTTVAVDPDQSFGNGGITYQILPPYQPELFSIDKANGTITALRSLDRESTPEYTLRIEVSTIVIMSDCLATIVTLLYRLLTQM